MKMNKKGALIHLIMLGVLMSLGIFILVTRTMDIAVTETKGAHQLDFLNNVYLEAEKDLLFSDQNAKEAGWKAINQLLEEPGTGECGQITDHFLGFPTKINLLNEKENWCNSDSDTKFIQLVQQDLNEFGNFSNIRTEGTDFIATGTKRKISNEGSKYHQTYTYDTSFRVQVGYNLNEFDSIISAAKMLVEECRNYEDLDNCIDNNFATYFQDNYCPFFEIAKEDRKRMICVASPNNYTIYTQFKNAQPIQYELALDFSPTEILQLESNEDEGITINFDHEPTADSYALYYTDYLTLEGRTGDIQQVFTEVPEVLGYQTQTYWITSWEESCDFINYNQPYLCAEQIVYKFQEDDLSSISSGHLFIVTSISEGIESEIKETILIE
jgi:hypothetical protein